MAYPVSRRTIFPLFRRLILRDVTGVENIPRDGAFILVSNHASFLDAIHLTSIITLELGKKVRFITKQEYYYAFWPIASRWLGMIPRYDRQPAGALEEAQRLLKSGELIGIFPEGSVNPDRQNLRKGKTGAARLALATKTRILPAGYQGPLTPSPYEAFKRFFHPREHIRIKFGQPFHLSELYDRPFSYELLRQATALIMEKISVLSGKRLHPEDAALANA